MAPFALRFDGSRGVLVLQVFRQFEDCDVAALGKDLTDAVAQARRHGPLRLLCDNRVDRAFPRETHETLWQIVGTEADPADRVAILVANSLAKVRSRDQARKRAEAFASEHAAYLWLTAGSPAMA